MHEQMSLRCFADLPSKGQEALNIFAGRGAVARALLDHITKALDQPPVRRERGKRRRVCAFGPRIDKTCVTPAAE